MVFNFCKNSFDRPETVLMKFLEKHTNVSLIHFHWTDFCGILNSRVVTKLHAIKLAKSKQALNVAPGSMIGTGSLSAFAHVLSPGGFLSLYPDWSSLRVLSSEHASVICSASEEYTCHPGVDLASNSFARCPRETLKGILHRASQEPDSLSFLVGFELEFFLLTPSQCENVAEPISEACCKHWNTASSMRGPLAACVQECAETLQHAGVEVEQFHAETGAHQFEIVTGPLPALQAVDALTQSKEIVKVISSQHNLRATFLPSIPKRESLGTSGLHAHLSIHRIKESLRPKSTDSLTAELEHSFLAGMLDSLPGLCALGMPNDASFSRLDPSTVGEWVAWGTGNRFVPIRAIAKDHWELRPIDATANMYLTLAAYIAAGLLGLQDRRPLRTQDCRQFLRRLDVSERERLGILVPMPTRVEEAQSSLRGDGSLMTYLGEDLLSLYFEVKKQEAQYLKNLPEDDKAIVYLKNY